MVLDVVCRVLGSRVVPGGILERLSAYCQVVVAGLPLPWTTGVSGRGREDGLVDRVWWEIDVALDRLVSVRRGDDIARDLRRGSRHRTSLGQR